MGASASTPTGQFARRRNKPATDEGDILNLTEAEELLLLKLRQMHIYSPDRLRTIITRGLVSLEAGTRGENFLRIKPVIVKFSRVFGRNPEMRNAFRRVGEYVPERGLVEHVYFFKDGFLSDAVKNGDLVTEILSKGQQLNLWNGDSIATVNSKTVAADDDAEGHPLWPACVRLPMTVSLCLRNSDERFVLERMQELYLLDRVRTSKLVHTLLELKGALDIPRPIHLRPPPDLTHGNLTEDQLRAEVGVIYDRSPRRALFLLAEVHRVFSTKGQLSREQMKGMQALFKIHAHGRGSARLEKILTVAELLAIAPHLRDLESKVDLDASAEFESGSGFETHRGEFEAVDLEVEMPPAIKKLVPPTKLWHLWWCCREILSNGLLDSLLRLGQMRDEIFLHASGATLWVGPGVDTEALKPRYPGEGEDEPIFVAHRDAMGAVLHSERLLLEWVEKHGDRVELLGKVWPGDLITSVAQDTILEKEPHVMFYEYIRHRAPAQPLTLELDWHYGEADVFNNLIIRYVQDPPVALDLLRDMLQQMGHIPMIPSGWCNRTDNSSAEAFRLVGCHLGNSFNQPPSGATSEGAVRWLKGALEKVQGGNKPLKAAARRVLGTQELWGPPGQKDPLFADLKKFARERLRSLGRVYENKVYKKQQIAEHLGQIGIEFLKAKPPRQDSVIPLPNWGPDGDELPEGRFNRKALGESICEQAYIIVLISCALALDSLVLKTVQKAARQHRGAVWCPEVKSYVRLQTTCNTVFKRAKNPRAAANLDVCRYSVTFPTIEQLAAGFNAIKAACGPVVYVRNRCHMTFDAKKKTGGVRCVIMYVDFSAFKNMPWSHLFDHTRTAALWEAWEASQDRKLTGHVNWTKKVDKARSFLASKTLRDHPIRMIVEIKLMTRDYLQLQKRSALLHQVVKAKTSELLCYQLKNFKIA